MSRLFRLSLLAGTSALLLAGCASVPVTEVAPLNARIEQATGQALNTTRENSADRTARIDALLAEPLSPEMAARIAIASSPRVEAAFGELGIARADYLEGALPSNPMIHAARLLKKDGGSPSLSYGFGLDLLSLITLPARRASAKGGWEAAKARAVGETLMVAGNGRLAMIDFIAANQNLDLMRQANEASQAALVAAEAIFEAGNSPRVEVDRERLFAAEIALSLKQAEADLVPARERVNVALGLSASQRAVWTAARRLPAPPTEPIDVDGAEANVVAASTDLAAATGALRAARAMRSTSGLTSLLPGLELSGERERDDGEWKRGFGLGVGLPIFGLGGSQRLRAQSQAQLASANLAALDGALRAEARTAAAMTEAMRQMAIERREVILPLSAQVFAGEQLNFNAMQAGIFQLLAAKRMRLDAGRASVMATRNYWAAQAGLDLLLQGLRAGKSENSAGASANMPQAPAGH
ncbi:MAG: hypothetical protein RL145_1323 [Pseudomonadota bacterium]|jgi:cobalt-zinc-cadmium efflux system outer membrane protein